MKVYVGVKVKIHAFLISPLDECEWSTSYSRCSYLHIYICEQRRHSSAVDHLICI